MDLTDDAERLFEAASNNDPDLVALVRAFADEHGIAPLGVSVLRALAGSNQNPFARELAARELERLELNRGDK